MSAAPRTVIAANGSYVPTRVVPNSEFLDAEFLDAAGRPFGKTNREIVEQLETITGIVELGFARETMLKEGVISMDEVQFIHDAKTVEEALRIIQQR